MPRDLFKFITNFWKRVDKRGQGDCWLWTGSVTTGGYGQLGWRSPDANEKVFLRAHRVAYHLVNGAPPAGQIVMHACDTRRCCNPGHLVAGSVAENNRDRAAKGRSSHHAPPPNSRRLRGREHPSATLTPEQVATIARLCDEGRASQRLLAKQYSVSQATISLINRHQHWSQDNSLHK
jgi:hypothetical protein